MTAPEGFVRFAAREVAPLLRWAGRCREAVRDSRA
jgi:hypothetical protein